MRDRRLQGIEAIVERQERVTAEGDEDRLLLDREHRGFRFTRAGWQIGDGAALLPFGDGLRVDVVAPGQRPQPRLLYCIARRITSVVVALPWRTWPIVHPSMPEKMVHHQNLGS